MASRLDRDPYKDCPSNCEVVLPGPRQLFLDLDDGAQINDNVLASLVKNGYDIRYRMTTTSRNGGEHVYFEVEGEDLTPIERVLLQACLGSDPVREVLSFLRIKRNHPTPTTFFELKEED